MIFPPSVACIQDVLVLAINTFNHSLRSFGKDDKSVLRTSLHYPKSFMMPFIRRFMEEIAQRADKNLLRLLPLNRRIEGILACPSDLSRLQPKQPPVAFRIAVLTARRTRGASIPRVPTGIRPFDVRFFSYYSPSFFHLNWIFVCGVIVIFCNMNLFLPFL